MATQGPNNPGTMANDATTGAHAWADPDNAKTSNDVYSVTTWSSGSSSQYLKATNFGFSIPSGATINGILVEIERKGNATCSDYETFIVKADGTWGTTDKATGTVIPDTDTYISFGANNDLWDESWTAENINDVDFGVVYRVSAYNGPISVDHIRITITYTAGGGGQTYSLVGVNGDFTLSGISAAITKTINLSCSLGQFTVTGVTTIFSKALKMASDTGNFVLNGVETTFSKALKMTGEAGSFAVNGIETIFSKALKMSADTGSFAVTGIESTFRKAINAICSAGSFILNGIDAVLTYTPPGSSGEITVQPANDDCRIYKSYGGADDAELVVNARSDETGRFLARYSFSTLVAGATITNATLSSYYWAKGAQDPVGRTYNACMLTQTGWTEGAKWHLYNGTSSWIALGGDYTTYAIASAVVPASFGWMDWDVTDQVKWFQANASNVADIIVKDSDETADYTGSFYSSENDNVNKPKLVITYTTIAGMVYTMVITAGEIVLTGIDTTLRKSLNMVGDVGSFALNGTAPVLSKAIKMVSEAGSFILNGIDATLTYTFNGIITTAYNMAVTAGEFALTGIETTLKKTISITCSVGSFILNGIDAVITKTSGIWTNQSQSGDITANNVTKSSITPLNISKNNITPVNTTKNSMSPSNISKNNSSFINNSKS